MLLKRTIYVANVFVFNSKNGSRIFNFKIK